MFKYSDSWLTKLNSLAVKAQDYITYTPPVAHAVVLSVGGILSVTISPRGNAI